MEDAKLVTDAELTELTGLKKPGAQSRWLRERGIGYFLRRDGKPRTTWDAVNLVLYGTSTIAARPDFAQVL